MGLPGVDWWLPNSGMAELGAFGERVAHFLETEVAARPRGCPDLRPSDGLRRHDIEIETVSPKGDTWPQAPSRDFNRKATGWRAIGGRTQGSPLRYVRHKMAVDRECSTSNRNHRSRCCCRADIRSSQTFRASAWHSAKTSRPNLRLAAGLETAS